VRRTLAQIEDTYRNKWGIGKKFVACNDLVIPWIAVDAWDINPLVELGMTGEFNFKPPAKQGTGRCDRNVAYGDHCYHAAAANFIAYGKMCSLCEHTFGWVYYPVSPWGLPETMARVALWKFIKYFGDQMFETLDFTVAGYDGRDPVLRGTTDQCAIHDDNFAHEDTLEWKWYPYYY